MFSIGKLVVESKRLIQAVERDNNNDINNFYIIKEKIEQIRQEGYKYIGQQLDVSQLPETIDPVCRKYMVLTYNYLADEDILDILKLPANALYRYRGGSNITTHDRLQCFANRYMNIAGHRCHFGYGVIDPLRHLVNKDLNELNRYLLEKELQKIVERINYRTEKIQNMNNIYFN